MITIYSFSLYGRLWKEDTNETDIVPTIRRGEFIELDIDNELWIGTINDVKYFPPDISGTVIHVYIHNMKQKYQSSTPTVSDKNE